MQQYARYRAPAESGQKLISPAWAELPAQIEANGAWRRQAQIDLDGQQLAEFTAGAREEIFALAEAYVGTYHTPSARPHRDLASQPLIVTGHQPEIVHPGVWFKNFAAAELARLTGGVALNLVIDADACRNTAIRVPTGSIESPRFESIAFDHPAAKIPWEERNILDTDLWRSFPERVREATSGLLSECMLGQWWPTATARVKSTGLIGASLAQARHLAELDWGRASLELPQSEMCRSEAFRRFTCHLLQRLPQFTDAYNGALEEYRREHRIRNRAHPVSNLASVDGWLQAPFWIWSTDDPVRRAVYARWTSGGMLLSDLEAFERLLPLDRDGATSTAVAALNCWEADGYKLRSRALVTTMFARLVLADLFLHGIGGAKYDEATDSICRRFFGAPPPPFATASGTLRLPIVHSAGGEADVSRVRQELRELDYHPEFFIGGNGEATALDAATSIVAEKQRWICTPKSRSNAADRHAAIVDANQRLQPFVVERRRGLVSQLAELSEKSRANRILDSREYGFCLYPARLLREFMLALPGNLR